MSPPALRIFHVGADRFVELPQPPESLPDSGFLWIGCSRADFEANLGTLQDALHRWEGGALVDLHVSDLLNQQLPSQFDYTSWYDMLVFRRLAAAPGSDRVTPAEEHSAGAAGARQVLASIDTNPVGFAVFDRVLLTVHPDECAVREHFAQRLAALAGGGETRIAARLPVTPADLMLRMVNHLVDGYLDLRRQLTRQLGTLQQDLIDPRSRFHDWSMLLEARNALHALEDTCEDQRSSIQEWIDTLDEWPTPQDAAAQRERDVLRVRSRDVQEHIERVLAHVRRLEQASENAVQLHFSALSHRTNDIMRTLTVLTAIFLPLNLITGFFGMNFDTLPLIHTHTGVWITIGLMASVGLGLGAFFWRKRYLGTRRG
jgi:Mg2+ and Co2+ transporter CorA